MLDGEGIAAGPHAAPMQHDDLSVADVHNLMACVCNAQLQSDVRCSAATQLSALCEQPNLLAAIAVPSFLDGCLRQVERAVGIAEPQAESNDGDIAAAAPLSIFQMQLPVACLVLLGTLCAHSRGVLVRSQLWCSTNTCVAASCHILRCDGKYAKCCTSYVATTSSLCNIPN